MISAIARIRNAVKLPRVKKDMDKTLVHLVRQL